MKLICTIAMLLVLTAGVSLAQTSSKTDARPLTHASKLQNVVERQQAEINTLKLHLGELKQEMEELEDLVASVAEQNNDDVDNDSSGDDDDDAPGVAALRAHAGSAANARWRSAIIHFCAEQELRSPAAQSRPAVCATGSGTLRKRQPESGAAVISYPATALPGRRPGRSPE